MTGQAATAGAWWRVLLAVAAAPLVPGILWSVIVATPAPLLFAVPIAYGTMLLLGLPMYGLVRRFWRVSDWTAGAGGFFAGILAYVLLVELGIVRPYYDAAAAKAALLFGGFGIFAGFAFSLIHGETPLQRPAEESGPPGL
jgi:hypothetical protein